MTPACTLQVISGPAAGQEFEIDSELVIGRRDADLAIADDELSRRHAAVRPAEQGVIVEDLGSLNGTFVDGERIQGAVTLTVDATVRVGRSEMRLRLAEVEVPEAGPEQDISGDAGRTRLASTLPPEPHTPAPAVPEPEPIPQPQVTRVRAVPGAEPPDTQPPAAAPASEPEPIPQPQVTRVRAVPDSTPPPAAPEPERGAEPIPQPQVTRVRAVAGAEPPAGEPSQPAAIPEPQVTRVRAVAAPDASGDQEQAKPPGLIKRLLARLRGGGAGTGGADG
jgi:pSer/pThr/pTyr-binding forkhead associated (FHA) protein